MDKEKKRFHADLLQGVREMTATHPGRFTNGMRPVHAGEILREEYLAPLGMTSNALAKALNVSLSTVDDLVNERHGVTPELALRLARYFGGDAESWLNLQQAYELKVARRAHGQRIETEIKPRDGASE